MSQFASRVLPDALELAWDIARLFPPQGGWSEAEYFALPGNHLTEFDHGQIEVRNRPSEFHQLLVAYLWQGKIREPDVGFMRREHASRRHEKYW